MLMLLIGREEGFSLLEILIVMILIAILVSVNLPNFTGFLDSIEKRGELLKIEHIFQLVREKSISQQRRLELLITDNQIIYQVGDQQVHSLMIEIVSRSADKISYYPDGSSSGGSFSINILSDNIYFAVVDQITGEIKWSN